ncbi:MAG TPA: DUF4176 domain-containing protein [Clostridiaceae bacterium]|nr:DUF4176 domain-containing protein [Clostridiaceae bacterium]
MKKDELLPMGTVLFLKDGVQKVMIIGRGTVIGAPDGKQYYYDYTCCPYPMGLDKESIFFFNQEDVARVEFLGYVDETEEQFRERFVRWIEETDIPQGKTEE